jgi:hypothetical protein
MFSYYPVDFLTGQRAVVSDHALRATLEIRLREKPLAFNGVRFRQVQGIKEMHCEVFTESNGAIVVHEFEPEDDVSVGASTKMGPQLSKSGSHSNGVIPN